MQKKEFSAKITLRSYLQLSESDKNLVEKAKEFMQGAYAPYSKFYVGAALQLSDGELVGGSNQENEAYPSGMCAERVALFYASAQYPRKRIDTLAIVAYNANTNQESEAFPCGACRQVLCEYEKLQKSPIRILVAVKDKVYIIESAQILLPFAFSNDKTE